MNKLGNMICDELINGLSYMQVMKKLNCSKSNISYYAKKLKLHRGKKQLFVRYNWEEVKNYYEAGHSAKECIRKFGFTFKTWSSAIKRGVIEKRDHIIPIEQVLVKGRHTHTYHLKHRLLKLGILTYKCDHCGISTWRGKKLSLQLDHKNGDDSDNRLENLHLLCPNCHTQTPYYGSRNPKWFKTFKEK
jgi:hypothetical protein